MVVRIVWIGFHEEGIPAFKAVCEAGYDVVGFFTLEQAKATRRSANADYQPLCRRFGVPLIEVDHINDAHAVSQIRELNADIGIVLGWGQILSGEVLTSTTHGMIGAHASLLPHNRGSAPVNWAIIRGEKETGNTLMWLSEGVDSGEIIDQRRISISAYDTCATIYKQVALTNRDMVLGLLEQLGQNQRPGRPQEHSDEELLPRRRPRDGEIDWTQSSTDIYNLIRALARPYPGAFGMLNGRRCMIWEAAVLPQSIGTDCLPGTILGPVYSPSPDACGQIVACGDGAIILLEIEDGQGTTYRGRELSELTWLTETQETKDRMIRDVA